MHSVIQESASLMAVVIFPEPCAANEDGLLAIGGDLSMETCYRLTRRVVFRGIQKVNRFFGGLQTLV